MSSITRRARALLALTVAASTVPVFAGSSAVTAETPGCLPASTRTALPLTRGTSLVQGQQYAARSGTHSLVFQSDGNVVVYGPGGQPTWSIYEVFPDVGRIACVNFGNDGNLALFDANGSFLWGAFTDGSQSDFTANLDINAVGALQVASPKGVTWSSNGDLTTEFDVFRNAIGVCQAGTELLTANMYAYPEDPAVAPGDRRAWAEVYNEFSANHLPSCRAVGAAITPYRGLAVLASSEQALAAANVANWNELFDGPFGIVNQGSRVPSYCPGLHLSQFDCVKATGRITASAAGVRDTLAQLATVECFPAYGWGNCLQITSPKITIYGATTTSQAAMNLVKEVYSVMTSRLTANYPKETMDGFVVYLTNAGPWSEVSQLAPIGTMWLNAQTGEDKGDELRGGAGRDHLWIDQQMMCATGVQTRNQAHDEGRRAERDDVVRTVDQVVHEFAHSIDARFGLRPRIDSTFPGAYPPAEAWAGAVQGKFSAPASQWTTLTEPQMAFVNEVFGPDNHTFTCF